MPTPGVVQPPFYDPPIVDYATGQQHSQAWTEYHQSVADQIAANTSAIAARKGVTDGSDAATGQIGEYIEAGSTSDIALSNGVAANVVTLALPAGDWDVSGNVIFNPGAAVSYAAVSVNNISAGFGRFATRIPGSGVATQLRIGAGGPLRMNVGSPITMYLVAQAGFSSGSVAAGGVIWARRQR